jgi:predicted Zn-dependent protease
MRGEFGGGRMGAGGLQGYATWVLEQMLQNTPAEIGAAEQVRIGGVPALLVPVMVRGQQGAVQLSLAAYAGPGGQAYHFVMVSQPGGSAALSQLFRSFHLLTDQEVRSLRPRRIQVVRAAPGDTLQALAGRIAADNPLDLFMMLNARPAGKPLKPGELVKIVSFAGR